jgi:enamine deaminase RidA (YjgF/YER057c/UK114 family)
MTHHFEEIHLEENDPKWNMPYVPAIKVTGGAMVFVSGVTAASVYHSHPHIATEFDGIPADPGEQTRMTAANLRRCLRAAGGDLSDIVQLFRFIAGMEENQDAINAAMRREMEGHLPTTTTVEVTRLATDPRLVLELAAVAVVPIGPSD